jgi:hypothetical protein
MKEILGLLGKLARSPSTYLYWAISAAGATCAHFNTGLNGSPLLGAASIASGVLCLAIFYFHLNRLRKELTFPAKRSAAGLFLSIYAFRIRLLLVFSPLIALLFWQGTFGRLASEYLVVTLAPPQEKFHELVSMLPRFWLLLATATAFYFLDLAGRSQVVARGKSTAALRGLPFAIKRLWMPLLVLVATGIALFAAGEYFAFLDYVKITDKITLSLALSWALDPAEYALPMVSALYLAKRLNGAQ